MVDAPKPKLEQKKKKKLSRRVRELAKNASISPKQLAKLRGSNIPTSAARGGVGKGQAGR